MREKFHTLIKKPTFDPVLLVCLALLALGVAVYGAYNAYHLNATVGEMASTSVSYDERVSKLEEALEILRGQNDGLNLALQQAEDRRRELEEDFEDVSSTVGTLEKLSKTDKELLQKYSKVYFLNEHYVPTNLVTIASKYLSDPSRSLQLHAEVWPELKRMLDAAAREGITLRVVSAYRSFGTQAGLKASYNFTYGAGTANQFSAEQGFSEHQLGTTVDLTTPEIGGALAGFANTPAYDWLTDNAYRYGFTLSYPPNNNYYQFEPWHWRYVGSSLARRLYREKIYFYDLDQREIDKYLADIFD